MIGTTLILTIAAATFSFAFLRHLAARMNTTKVLATTGNARWLGHIA